MAAAGNDGAGLGVYMSDDLLYLGLLLARNLTSLKSLREEGDLLLCPTDELKIGKERWRL